MTRRLNFESGSKTIMLMGANPAEAHPVSLQHILEGKELNRANMIVIDPRMTRTAAHATEYVRVRPGTHIPAIYGMLWHIFNNGWEDSEFLNQRVYGVDEIRKEVAKWSPKETERVTGLPEAQVRHIAEMFAKQKPATLIWARHYWRSRQGAPARPRSQGHQAGRHPPDPYERRNEAHGVRDRLTCALRTAGARSAGDHCRHTRLHGPRTNRAHEPLDGRWWQSLRTRRHAVPDAHRLAAVHSGRPDGEGAQRYRARRCRSASGQRRSPPRSTMQPSAREPRSLRSSSLRLIRRHVGRVRMVRRHSFAYSRKSLFDVENAIIIGAEATIAIRQAEVLAAKRMIERSMEPLWALSGRLMGDSAFESAEMLARLVHEHGIEPHIPAFDKSRRQDGTFRRSDFVYDRKVDVYICPAGKLLKQSLAVKVKSPVVEAPQ